MKQIFIEFPAFTRRVQELANDEILQKLQNELMQQPDKGVVIQGTGGFRKIRMALPGSRQERGRTCDLSAGAGSQHYRFCDIVYQS